MNTSLDQLKQELLTQKSAIEAKGGTVSTTYTNPSPAEITAGINSISILDTSSATATEADVLKGKTFYAGTSSIKTGTFEAITAEDLKLLFNNVTPDTTTEKDFHVWPGTTTLRPYFMANNSAKINLYFSDEIQTIGEHAFEDCVNFSFKNLYEVTNLKNLNHYSFRNCKCFDFSNLPASIEYLGSSALANTCIDSCTTIKINANMTSFGSQSLANESIIRRHMQNLDLSEFTGQHLGEGMVYGYIFHCNFVTPSTILEVPASFNSCGGFIHVTIGSQITRVGGSSLSIAVDETDENNIMQDITFEGETPPNFGYRPFGPPSKRTNLKIYVPDQSIEAYKAKSQFTQYSSCVTPMSQKP